MSAASEAVGSATRSTIARSSSLTTATLLACAFSAPGATRKSATDLRETEDAAGTGRIFSSQADCARATPFLGHAAVPRSGQRLSNMRVHMLLISTSGAARGALRIRLALRRSNFLSGRKPRRTASRVLWRFMQQVFRDVRILDAYGTFRAWAQKANSVDPELSNGANDCPSKMARPGDWLSSDGCQSCNVRDQKVERTSSIQRCPPRRAPSVRS